MINYVNDERFSKGTLKFLIEQLNGFVDMLKGNILTYVYLFQSINVLIFNLDKIIEFKINHFKNTEILQNNFTVRMVTISNDCIRLRECFLNIRNKYDKFMDKDEVGGPNDLYEKLGVKISNVSAIW